LALVWDEMCNSPLSNTASPEFDPVTFYNYDGSCDGKGFNPSSLPADKAPLQRYTASKHALLS